jgi:hypothetical protein
MITKTIGLRLLFGLEDRFIMDIQTISISLFYTATCYETSTNELQTGLESIIDIIF